MEEKSTNSSYSNYEFEELLQDKANLVCFDCGRGPASWASVNNAIYLCMNCAGEHRSYGVSVSYIRSINIDKWNDTQINCMKVGGNRRLEELLTKFEVPRKTSPKMLYSSKLLEYHRNQIKSDVNKGKQITPPSAEEALEPAVSVNVSNNVNTNSNFNASNSIYSVTSSGSNDFNGGNNQNQANFFSFSSFGSMLNSALETGKSVASNVTDKIKEMDLTNKIITTGTKGLEVMKDTGSKTFDVLKDTSSKVMEKGKEYGVIVKEKGSEFAQSEPMVNIKSKVEGGVSFLYGKIFGNSESSSTTQSNSTNENDTMNNPTSNEPCPPQFDKNFKLKAEMEDDITINNQFK